MMKAQEVVTITKEILSGAGSKKKINLFCQRHHVLELALFGSILRPDFQPTSDIDVLIEFNPNFMPSLFEIVHLEEELAQIFHWSKVDLRTRRDLSRYFRDEVIAGRKVLYDARRSNSIETYA